MVALLVAVPELTGASMTEELYSPHLDLHQRLLILETLATAAQQMASPRLRLAAQGRQTDTHSDRLLGSGAGIVRGGNKPGEKEEREKYWLCVLHVVAV